MMKPEKNLDRLYWFMRSGMAFIWVWTAIVSWFIFPQSESLEMLRRVGIISHAFEWFVAACILDLAMGIASAFFARRILWQIQILIVAVYSLIISFALPDYLIHPFGPITKNIAVLGCLAYLAMTEER